MLTETIVRDTSLLSHPDCSLLLVLGIQIISIHYLHVKPDLYHTKTTIHSHSSLRIPKDWDITIITMFLWPKTTLHLPFLSALLLTKRNRDYVLLYPRSPVPVHNILSFTYQHCQTTIKLLCRCRFSPLSALSERNLKYILHLSRSSLPVPSLSRVLFNSRKRIIFRLILLLYSARPFTFITCTTLSTFLFLGSHFSSDFPFDRSYLYHFLLHYTTIFP